jgi:hypothetical protein
VAVTEGEGVIVGLRKLEEVTAFGKYAKAAQTGMGQSRARPAGEKGGPVGLAGLRGRVGWLAAGPIGPNVKEKNFPNKIWFLNIARLWKIVEGDLGGILTWGFFLNSSRLLKDFRKILYAMPCNASCTRFIIFFESFSYVL